MNHGLTATRCLEDLGWRLDVNQDESPQIDAGGSR
jgi:hypothetical protein